MPSFFYLSSHACTNLNAFPVSPLYGVLHLVAGVETREGGEGVDPWAAWARKRPHEAGDAAQSWDGVRRQGRVHQQVWHQVPGLVDDWKIHAVAAHCTLPHAHGGHLQYYFCYMDCDSCSLNLMAVWASGVRYTVLPLYTLFLFSFSHSRLIVNIFPHSSLIPPASYTTETFLGEKMRGG